MKLSEMLLKAEKKLKNSDENLVISPWQTTSIKTRTTESKNHPGTNIERKIVEIKNHVGTNVIESKNQVGTNIYNKLHFRIQHLKGIQLALMHYIYINKFNENKQFFIHINTKKASMDIEVSLDIFRVSLRRIENKKIIIRESGVMGRHGFSIFHIPLEIIKFFDKFHTNNINKYHNLSDIIHLKHAGKYKIITELQKKLSHQKQNKFTSQSKSTVTNIETKKLAICLNNPLQEIDKKSIIKNSIEMQKDQEIWANIDFSPLVSFGFKKSHIKQIINANTTLTPQEVEDSIEHYAWALENRREEMKGYAPVNNPLRGLLGVLKKGNAWVEGSYKSPEELALELQIKAKRTQLERQQSKKEALFNIEFEMWYNELSREDITKIEVNNSFKSIPASTFNKKMNSNIYRSLMQGYYRDKVLR